MPKIINPFYGESPVARTFNEFGNAMFGDRLGQMKRTEELVALQRENAETENLMNLVNGGGAHTLGNSPMAHAMIIGSGYKPSDFADLGLLGAATEYGRTDPRTQDFQIGSGQSFTSTADAFNSTLAETIRNNNMRDATERYKFDMEPLPALGADGAPTFTTQISLEGFSPILSDTEAKGTFAQQNFGQMGDLPSAEQNYLGADAGSQTPRNYVGPDGSRHITYDGVTAAGSGAPLPPGGYIAGVEGGAEESLGANALTTQSTNDDQGTIRQVDGYFVLSNQMRELAQTRPELFGLVGNVRGKAQELFQMVPALQSMFGGQDLNTAAQGMLHQYANNPEAAGLFTQLASTYDEGLPTVATLGVMLKYQLIAAALGQSGRDLSDKDLAQGEKLIPDPQGIFSSSQSTIAALDLFDNIMAGKRQAAQARLDAGNIQAGAPAGAAPSVQPQGGEAQEGDTIVNPTTGERLRLQNGQWVPA